MTPIINHHYSIPFADVKSFEFTQYGVDETCYLYRIMPHIPKMVEMLSNEPTTRGAIIAVLNNDNRACLNSLHFQIENNILIVVACFRSQCEDNGRPFDTVMLQYVANIVREALDLEKFEILVNVGNYHKNLELTRARLESKEIQANIANLFKTKTKGVAKMKKNSL